jgi:hypothetical protein
MTVPSSILRSRRYCPLNVWKRKNRSGPSSVWTWYCVGESLQPERAPSALPKKSHRPWNKNKFNSIKNQFRFSKNWGKHAISISIVFYGIIALHTKENLKLIINVISKLLKGEKLLIHHIIIIYNQFWGFSLEFHNLRPFVSEILLKELVTCVKYLSRKNM